jgi:ATP-dependent DNA ligase
LVETTSGAKKDAQRMLTHYMGRGQEGAILRDPKAPYMVDKRSNGLQKLKAFLSKEYKIVEGQEGNGREAGAVVWVCTTGVGGSLFKARPLGSIEERKRLYREREQHIGKLLTVKYQDLTLQGVPRFPIGLTLRNYE